MSLQMRKSCNYFINQKITLLLFLNLYNFKILLEKEIGF
jgi:hypothetical protein